MDKTPWLYNAEWIACNTMAHHASEALEAIRGVMRRENVEYTLKGKLPQPYLSIVTRASREWLYWINRAHRIENRMVRQQPAD